MSRPRPYEVKMTMEFYDLMAMSSYLRRQGFDRDMVENHIRQVPCRAGEHPMVDSPGCKIILRNIDIGGGRSNPL